MNSGRRFVDRLFEVFGLALLIAVLAIVVTRGFGIDFSVEWNAEWEVWTVLTAIGTVGATVIALTLAYRAGRAEQTAVARVVSAWVTDEFVPQEAVPAYKRVVKLHVANESDAPVFEADVCVIVGQRGTRVGPLAAPPSINTIPARRQFTYDITLPMLAHEDTWNPRAEITFTDPRQRVWFRDATGALSDVTNAPSGWSRNNTAPDERQLGDLTTQNNPMAVAIMFLNMVRADQRDLPGLTEILAGEAKGWQVVDWNELAKHLAGYAPTSFVDFPAPQVARVKLIDDVALQGRTAIGRKNLLSGVLFLTLTFDPAMGWRVFGVGADVRPEAILFREGGLVG